MTTEINYNVISEVIFSNDATFLNIDIKEAKVIACLCKDALLNKNVKLAFDIVKARDYFDKIFDIVFHYIMYKNKVAYLKRKEPQEAEDEGEDYGITLRIDDIIDELSKENEVVLQGFRELIVLEFKEYKYNYENCRDTFNDIQYNLDYCKQFDIIIYYLGYKEYCKAHIYDPKHFMMTAESEYDFANALEH